MICNKKVANHLRLQRQTQKLDLNLACPPVENVPAAKWVWSQSEGSPCRKETKRTGDDVVPVCGLHVFIVCL